MNRAAILCALLLTGCGRFGVRAPATPVPDFQKAVVMRCLGGAPLVDQYLSGFQKMTTPERIEFMVALQLAPCPAEVVEWIKKNSKEKQ